MVRSETDATVTQSHYVQQFTLPPISHRCSSHTKNNIGPPTQHMFDQNTSAFGVCAILYQ